MLAQGSAAPPFTLTAGNSSRRRGRATLILFLLWRPLGWLALIVTLWIAYFFRDPWRVTPTRPGLIVSPADGIVVSLGPAPPPPELGMGAEPVHPDRHLPQPLRRACRARAGRRPASRRGDYTKGRFVNASLDKASEHNERLAIRVAPEDGPEIAFVLIAGLVARRIVCAIYARPARCRRASGSASSASARASTFIARRLTCRWWSLGQRMVGGETVLADRLAQEPPRQGFAH